MSDQQRPSSLFLAKLTDAEIDDVSGSNEDVDYARSVADAATRKAWWKVVLMLERMENIQPVIALINGKKVRVAEHFADLARAAGLEPWEKE